MTLAAGALFGLAWGTLLVSFASSLGTDCPGLTSQRLRGAAAALEQADSVLGPVIDGGYALLGLNRFDSSLFEQIPWSTDRVAAITRARIESIDWQLWMGEILHDMDEPEDLHGLPDDWPPFEVRPSPPLCPNENVCKKAHLAND